MTLAGAGQTTDKVGQGYSKALRQKGEEKGGKREMAQEGKVLSFFPRKAFAASLG